MEQRRPRWEIIARIAAGVILVLLIAYAVGWWFGYLVPPPAGTFYPPRP